MNSFHRIVFFIILTILYSCQDNKEKSAEQEHTVMEEIFPTLIDSMWVEITYSMMPAPIREIYDSNSRHTEFESIEKSQAFKNEIVEELRKSKRNLNQITIVVSDTIHKIDEENVSQLRKHFQSAIFDETKEINNTEHKIDFSRYKADKVFNLIYASEFKSKKYDLSRENILSEISFSRILFDKDKIFGILTCEYICGGLCGNGYRIFIKKVNNRWIIDKIDESWIA
jgi:hypothetical protein